MSPEDINGIVEILKALNDPTVVKPNEWLPVYAALGGAAMGAIVSIIPNWVIESRRERSFSKQIKRCIIAEISAILKIAEQRKYLDAIQSAVNHLKIKPNENYMLVADIPDHYSRVYQENCKHLGVVDSKVSADIIIFYQLIDAVVQDIKPNGTFSANPTLPAYEETLNILTEALEIARNLQESI